MKSPFLNSRLILVLCLLFSGTISPLFSGSTDYRVWTNKKGQSIEAKLLRIRGKDIIIQRKTDHSIFNFPIGNLNAKDQEFVSEFLRQQIAQDALSDKHENYLANGDFEKSELVGWKGEDVDVIRTEVVRSDKAASGSRHLKLTKEGDAKVGYLYQHPFTSVDLPWNSRIVATAKVKVDNLEKEEDFNYAAIRIRIEDKDGKKLIYHSDKTYKARNRWDDLKLDFEIPSKKEFPQMHNLSFAIQVYGAEKWAEPVYFDDIKLIVTPLKKLASLKLD